MACLIITHILDGTAPRFEVVRRQDGKRAPVAEVVSPYGFPVKDRPEDNLMSQLGWYLERFLEYPFPPRTYQAANVEEALESWGRQAFSALFESGMARDWMTDAKRAEDFRLQISADDPAVLSWPWEALYDPEAGVLAHRARVERRLNQNLADPPPLSKRLPKDRINILLVTARPYEQDVQYRSISRPLVDLVQKERLPAQVHLLRPPTFDQLRKHLADHPHFYHILHFDGHGGYGGGVSPSAELFRGAEGRLVFEARDGKPDPIAAGDLSELLREHAVPVVVLNACQSAMIDVQARDPFASVAAALLRSGIRSVVAMAYSLYVRAAQEFLPPFYRELFRSGNVPEAVRRGRTELRAHPQRSGLAAEVKLRDWVVPVIYQQGEELDLSFGAGAPEQAGSAGHEVQIPEGAKLNPRYDFTGRDGVLLELERALRRKPAAILIHGLAGVGKTTLASAFVQWLRYTGGLGQGCFWFGFDDIHTAVHVFNEMGRALFGPEFGLGDAGACIDSLVKAFSEHPFVIVWDNFESVRGLPEAGIEPMLSAEDRSSLQRFLQKLRGAPTKVLITSRGEETWLAPQDCFKLALGGLRHEEVWEYAAQILDDLGLRVDRRDAALADLLEWLGGHPLAMQAVLLQLQKHTIAELRSILEQNLGTFSGLDDQIQRRLYSSLEIVRQSLDAELRPLLIPLSLHEKFVDADCLAQMAERADQNFSRAQIDRLVSALTPAGLLTERGSAIYEIHPLLPSFLRSEVLSKSPSEEVEKWTRAFLDVMARLGHRLTGTELKEQRISFALHQANFHNAMLQAEKLEMHLEWVALTESLAVYAFNRRNFVRAQELFAHLADHCVAQHDEAGAAIVYFELGRTAQEQRDFTSAERWHLKSLQIKEKLGDEYGAARASHELGVIAHEQRDFATAKRWYLKSLEIREKLVDEQGAALTYHQLGIIAQQQPDFAEAEHWYLKSLQIAEKLGDEHGAALTYHELGFAASDQGQFTQAAGWFLKALGGLRNDQASAQIVVQKFIRCLRQAPPNDRRELREMWNASGLAPLPDDD